MTTSRRLADKKIAKFQRNITRRGSAAAEPAAKKGKDYPVGPIVLGFFVFVVVGSCMFVTPHLNGKISDFSVPDNKNSNEWRICMKEAKDDAVPGQL